MSRDVTLGIPTYQRSAFLARKLRHLEREQFAGTVLIFDNSKDEHFERNRASVKRHSSSLFDLHYEICPPSDTFTEKITRAINASNTKYTAITADDDFLFLEAVRAGVEHLDGNPKFVSSDGHVLAYPRSRTGVPKNIPIISKSDVFEMSDPVQRLHAFLGSDRLRNPLFHLWRTEILQDIWRPFGDLPWTKHVELLFDHVATLAGPTKFVDQIFEMRHVDYKKSTYRSHGLSNFTSGFEYDLFDPRFAPTFEQSFAIADRYVQQQKSTPNEELKKLFADAFVVHRMEVAAPNLAVKGPSRRRETLSQTIWRRFRSIAGEAARTLRDPSRPLLILSLARLYTRPRFRAMLRYDPELRFNQITLTRQDSPDARAYNIAAEVAAEFPEIE